MLSLEGVIKTFLFRWSFRRSVCETLFVRYARLVLGLVGGMMVRKISLYISPYKNYCMPDGMCCYMVGLISHSNFIFFIILRLPRQLSCLTTMTAFTIDGGRHAPCTDLVFSNGDN